MENSKSDKKRCFCIRFRKRYIKNEYRTVRINEINKDYKDNTVSNTRYTILTFIPKNLWTQFSKFMNIYFLIIASLQLVPILAPVHPITVWAPIIVIFLVNCIKEGIDDFGRYKADKVSNELKYKAYIDGHKKEIMSKDIRVGNLIFVKENEHIPCDIVVLKSADADGLLYIQTSNLDGETNLKPRNAVSVTQSLNRDELINLKGTIECSQPNSDIYRFDSRMKIYNNNDNIDISLSESSESESRSLNTIKRENDDYDNDYIALDSSNLILQATTLRNVDWVMGVAVYTGNETKVGMNKHPAPTKWTQIDRKINRTSMMIFVLQLILTVLWGVLGKIFHFKVSTNHFYLKIEETRIFDLTIPLRFLLLMSIMIPISLRVTLDIAKYICSLLIQYDGDLVDENGEVKTKCNDSSVSEDLGQIEYVLTDKTGTLTENIMNFSQCSIGGEIYGSADTPATKDTLLLEGLRKEKKELVNFFKSLALCNTVLPSNPKIKTDLTVQDYKDLIKNYNENDYEIVYKSTSPDEEALVKAASEVGYVLKERTRDTVKIVIHNGVVEKYQVLHTLDFTSDRKRMSVILRNLKTKEIVIYSKGSDDIMLPRINFERCNVPKENVIADANEFANLGLRTLYVAMKTMKEEDYEIIKKKISDAASALENRDILLEEVYDTIERDFDFVGITAIEDKLQDYVPETISMIQEAGIKVWMLTGDKYETAIQISKSCNLIDSNSIIHSIVSESYDETLEKLEEALRLTKPIYQTQNVSAIINGNTLTWIQTPELKAKFLELAQMMRTVICCRVTPQQKAQVVDMVKQQKKICLAIGDGGNDVSMIQVANIGVGIIGKEGLQASKASDFVISRFKHLAHLLLVHGRWSYKRTAFIAHYCFHKSMFIALMQLFFAFFNGFSGASLFDGISLASYNVIFTGLPVMLYTLDKDIEKWNLLSNPRLYQDTQKGTQMNKKTLMFWGFRTILQAAIVYFLVLNWWVTTSDGNTVDYLLYSHTMYGVCVILQTLTMLIEYHNLTYLHHIVIWGTIVLYFGLMMVSNYVLPNLREVFTRLYSDPLFWFSLLLVVTVALLPVIVIKYVLFVYYPTESQIVRRLQNEKKRQKQIKHKSFNVLTRPLLYKENNYSVN